MVPKDDIFVTVGGAFGLNSFKSQVLHNKKYSLENSAFRVCKKKINKLKLCSD